MKEIDAFAAKFPATAAQPDEIAAMSNSLFAFPAVFKYACESKRLQACARIDVSDEYDAARLRYQTRALSELNCMLESLASRAPEFAAYQPCAGVGLLARQDQHRFVASLAKISRATDILQELQRNARLFAQRQQESQALNDRVDLLCRKAEQKWEMIQKEAQQLGI